MFNAVIAGAPGGMRADAPANDATPRARNTHRTNIRAGVIGHVEWTRIVSVNCVPGAGAIVSAHSLWEGPAGGGAVAAVQLARLAGHCVFFTALGDDAIGRAARQRLGEQGVEVCAVARDKPTREAVSLVDASGERTTITLGERLEPAGRDPLPWDLLPLLDGVYFAAGDMALLRQARAAGKLVATSRELPTISAAGIRLDALVGSARDPAEQVVPALLPVAPGLLVATEGADGGCFRIGDGPARRYPAVPPPGPVHDTYGVGDSFAAALTFGLARHDDVERALALAAWCGADCVARRGPFSAPPAPDAARSDAAVQQWTR